MSEATNSPQVSVVIPVFNEEENISILQSELRVALAGIDHEIVFVDDGSTDRTVEKIEHGTNVRVLRIEKNTGQSAALYVGCKAARGATVVMIDSDLQNDPADIPRLLAEISKGADMVCGYRRRRKDTMQKRIISRVANFVRSRYTGDGIRDTGCTLKAMRRECGDEFIPFKGMHRFMASLVKGGGYRIVEIPVNHRPRRFGQTKYGFGSRGLKTVRDLLGVRWLLDRHLSYKVREE
jgi:dolichol-phosphate mannosyltransferase